MDNLSFVTQPAKEAWYFVLETPRLAQELSQKAVEAFNNVSFTTEQGSYAQHAYQHVVAPMGSYVANTLKPFTASVHAKSARVISETPWLKYTTAVMAHGVDMKGWWLLADTAATVGLAGLSIYSANRARKANTRCRQVAWALLSVTSLGAGLFNAYHTWTKIEADANVLRLRKEITCLDRTTCRPTQAACAYIKGTPCESAGWGQHTVNAKILPQKCTPAGDCQYFTLFSNGVTAFSSSITYGWEPACVGNENTTIYRWFPVSEFREPLVVKLNAQKELIGCHY